MTGDGGGQGLRRACLLPVPLLDSAPGGFASAKGRRPVQSCSAPGLPLPPASPALPPQGQDRTGRERWSLGGGVGPRRLPSQPSASPAGRSGGTHRPAQRGRVRPGPGGRGARGTSWCGGGCLDSACLCRPAAPFILWAAARGPGVSAKAIWGSSAPALQAKPQRMLWLEPQQPGKAPGCGGGGGWAALGHSCLWVSPGPLRGPLQVPQRLLTLPWSPFPSLSSSCVWTARRGVGAERGRGATASQGGVADRRRLPLSAVGRSQTPEVGPAMPSFTLHEGSGRLGRRGPTPARPVCQDGRGRGPSQELSTNRGGAGPGHRPVRWGPWPCPLTGPLRARMWSAPVGS